MDCYGLLRLIYLNEFAIELPLYPGLVEQGIWPIAGKIAENAGREWLELERPVDGCAVGMSQREILHHVGIFATADGGRVIHCWDGHQTVADTMRGLALKGFLNIKFFQHRLWPTLSN